MLEFLVKYKDLLTSIAGGFVAAIGIINTYMAVNAGKPVDYISLITTLVVGMVGWYTGKVKTPTE